MCGSCLDIKKSLPPLSIFHAVFLIVITADGLKPAVMMYTSLYLYRHAPSILLKPVVTNGDNFIDYDT